VLQSPISYQEGTMFLFYQAVVCFLLLLTLPAAAQAQAFEKITIKPAHSADQSDRRVQVLPNGDLVAHSVSASD
jgi:hypothetical protein